MEKQKVIYMPVKTEIFYNPHCVLEVEARRWVALLPAVAQGDPVGLECQWEEGKVKHNWLEERWEAVRRRQVWYRPPEVAAGKEPWDYFGSVERSEEAE